MSFAESSAFLALTWLLWWIAMTGIGSLVVRTRAGGLATRGWIGLFVVSVVSMLLGIVGPLGGPAARVFAGLVVATGLVGALRSGVWRRWRLLVVLALTAALLALLSSVTPSNYDLGLYHAGSIAYVREGGTVVGLANLHDRFGFSSSMWPLSAFLGLGFWDGGEFRLLNGALGLLLVGDVALRWRTGRQRQPSTIAMTFGVVPVRPPEVS